MKLTTLGCWGAYPYKDGGTTSYLVTSEDGFQLLMDCGSRAVTELEKEISPLDLDAVIISHYHPDHVADLGVLRHYFQLYPKHLWEPKILPIYGHTEDEQEFAKLTLDGVSQGKAYDVNGVEKVGPFDITFIKTVHPVPCYAFRIVERATGQTLVFTGDTGYFEGNENHPAHLTTKEAGQIAKAAGVKSLVLTHTPPVPPQGISAENHLQVLKEEAQGFAADVPVDLAEPHKSWQIGKL